MNWKIIRILDRYLGIPLLLLARFLRSAPGPTAAGTVSGTARRILLVKFWGIGNLFMMLPSVRALRTAYPGAEIDILTLESNREAAGCIGRFDQVYTIDTGGALPFARSSTRMYRLLKRRQYDIVIDFEQFARYSALFCGLIPAGRSIGFETAAQYRDSLYSGPVPYDNRIHITLSYASLAQAAGAGSVDPGSAEPLLQAAPDAEQAEALVEKLGIDRSRMLIVFHIGTSSNFEERRWPPRSYARLAELLIHARDATIVLTGLREEARLAADFGLRPGSGIIDATSRLSFKEFFTLIRMSDLVVSADTAPVHIASALDVPVVGLYGPNTPLLYGPWGRSGLSFYKKTACSPCITNFNAKIHVCKHPEGKGACMRRIAPEEVYEKIQERGFGRKSGAGPGKPARLDICSR